MKKIFLLIWVVGVIFVPGVTGVKSSYAFDRNAMVQGARSILNVNNTYNVSSVIINSGSVTVGSTNHSLPAYQQIAQITAKIELLKQQLKSLRP